MSASGQYASQLYTSVCQHLVVRRPEAPLRFILNLVAVGAICVEDLDVGLPASCVISRRTSSLDSESCGASWRYASGRPSLCCQRHAVASLCSSLVCWECNVGFGVTGVALAVSYGVSDVNIPFRYDAETNVLSESCSQ